mmetsp:Transcript_168194/g.540350  ORF Transcript_168194/g.540350 Transcript_168194/m.540350 type:complete len:348 (-) Transcript_168194:1839-2882(-)
MLSRIENRKGTMHFLCQTEELRLPPAGFLIVLPPACIEQGDHSTHDSKSANMSALLFFGFAGEPISVDRSRRIGEGTSPAAARLEEPGVPGPPGEARVGEAPERTKKASMGPRFICVPWRFSCDFCTRFTMSVAAVTTAAATATKRPMWRGQRVTVGTLEASGEYLTIMLFQADPSVCVETSQGPWRPSHGRDCESICKVEPSGNAFMAATRASTSALGIWRAKCRWPPHCAIPWPLRPTNCAALISTSRGTSWPNMASERSETTHTKALSATVPTKTRMLLMTASPANSPEQLPAPHGGTSIHAIVCASLPQYVMRKLIPCFIASLNFTRYSLLHNLWSSTALRPC